MNVTPARISTLDGWRTISVALVIAGHLGTFSALGSSESKIGMLAALGVTIFFGISGFVIARGLVHEQSIYGRISLSGFYVRRFVRIVPPLVLYLATVVVLWRLGVIETDWSIARAMVFSCNFLYCGGYVGAHTWSLAVEEQFYLVIPVLLGVTLVAAPRMAFAIACSFPLLVVGLYAVGATPVAEFLSKFIVIFAGVACGLRESLVRRWLGRVLWIWPVAGAALIAIWVLPSSAIKTVVFALTAGPLVMTVLLGSASGYAARILSLPVMTELGMASYGIYLWQQLATYDYIGAGVLFYTISIGACVGFAWLAFRVLEAPMILMARTWTHRQEPPLAPPQ